jgi:hypothetical protein
VLRVDPFPHHKCGLPGSGPLLVAVVTQIVFRDSHAGCCPSLDHKAAAVARSSVEA